MRKGCQVLLYNIKISAEEAAKIKEYRKTVKGKYLDCRLHALQLLGEGMKASDIAKKLDADRRQVSEWSKQFNERGGLAGFIKKCGGRNHENMSLEEETEFLNQFKDKAEKGQIVETSEIKAAYDEKVGHKTGSSQIYYVLKRHNWRKVKPCSRHPKKTNDEAIKASKKLNPK